MLITALPGSTVQPRTPLSCHWRPSAPRGGRGCSSGGYKKTESLQDTKTSKNLRHTHSRRLHVTIYPLDLKPRSYTNWRKVQCIKRWGLLTLRNHKQTEINPRILRIVASLVSRPVFVVYIQPSFRVWVCAYLLVRKTAGGRCCSPGWWWTTASPLGCTPYPWKPNTWIHLHRLLIGYTEKGTGNDTPPNHHDKSSSGQVRDAPEKV